LVVAGAAAEIAGEPIARLFLGRVLVLVEERLCRDDKARRAKAALQRRMLEELLLDRVQLVAFGDALDSLDLAAFRFDTEHQARAHDLAVDDDGASAAIAGAAAFLAAGQVQFVAQAIKQRLLRLTEKFGGLAVDDGCYVMLTHSSVSHIRFRRATRRGRMRWRRRGAPGRRQP